VEILIHPDPDGHVDDIEMAAHDLLAPAVDGASPALRVQGGPMPR
jgi:ferrous-iron efflux pump FieF